MQYGYRRNEKILVVAGTHYRETGFSYPTADLIIAHYGGSAFKPQEEFVGIDKSRKAKLWDFGKIAVAKIEKIGDQSTDYLASLPQERLFWLAVHRLQTRHNGAELAETFEHESQWTSVHDSVLEATNPLFFFDLHSYHRETDGMHGTGADIVSYARQCYSNLMSKALEAAQHEEPHVYGISGKKDCPVNISSRNAYSTMASKFTREELMDVLAVPQGDVSNNMLVDKFSGKMRVLEDKAEREKSGNWGNQWYLRGGRYNGDEWDNFCFEAVHWQKENQKATARFVTKYLAELV